MVQSLNVYTGQKNTQTHITSSISMPGSLSLLNSLFLVRKMVGGRTIVFCSKDRLFFFDIDYNHEDYSLLGLKMVIFARLPVIQQN